MRPSKALEKEILRHEKYVFARSRALSNDNISRIGELTSNLKGYFKNIKKPTSRAQVDKILTRVAKQFDDKLTLIESNTLRKLNKFARLESKYIGKYLKDSGYLDNANTQSIVKAARLPKNTKFSAYFKDRKNPLTTVQSAVKLYSRTTKANFLKRLRIMLLSDVAIDDFHAEIDDLADQMRHKATYQNRAVIQTASAQLSVSTSVETWSKLPSVAGFVLIVTYDHRTSKICMPLGYKYYPKDKFVPPPYHENCRTVPVPITYAEIENE